MANIEFNALYISTENLMGKDQNLAVNTFKHWNLVLKDSNYSKKKTLAFQFQILAFLQIDIPQSVNRTKTEKSFCLNTFIALEVRLTYGESM